jgi:dihydropteroate synthase
MGVVNVTPDSFSDGGRYLEPGTAVERALELVRQGADILDVGGESTRPLAEPVSETEELHRVLPVLEQLRGKVQVPVSIDTMKPAVALAALDAGAAIVNDVGAALEQEPMWRLVAERGAGYVCMHMQGTPRTMQLHPEYANVEAEVGAFFSERLSRLARCGVQPEQIILDPGIGFGKTAEHNLRLLACVNRFARLERPLLIGVSRKSFLGKVTGAEVQERVPAGLACVCLAVAGGAHMFRTHDVAETVQALRMAEAILAKRVDV